MQGGNLPCRCREAGRKRTPVANKEQRPVHKDCSCARCKRERKPSSSSAFTTNSPWCRRRHTLTIQRFHAEPSSREGQHRSCYRAPGGEASFHDAVVHRRSANWVVLCLSAVFPQSRSVFPFDRLSHLSFEKSSYGAPILFAQALPCLGRPATPSALTAHRVVEGQCGLSRGLLRVACGEREISYCWATAPTFVYKPDVCRRRCERWEISAIE